MLIIEKPITGAEIFGDRLSPNEALVHFYYAFNHRNIYEMEKNWLNSDIIAMNNLLSGIKRGWSEIKQV